MKQQKNKIKKILLLILINLITLSFIGCQKQKEQQIEYKEEDFLDNYYGYVENEILHLTNEEIEGKTIILKKRENVKKQIKKQFTTINIDNVILLKDGSYMFDHIKNVKINGLEKLIVKKAYKMFSYSEIQTDFSKLETKYIEKMDYMFAGCKKIETLNINNWNTSNVTSMEGLFYGCEKLKNINISNWDVSNVTSMAAMFERCKNIENLDLENWNIKKVNELCDMFCGCDNLQVLNITNWDVSNVEDMNYMFAGCKKLQNLDLNNWNVIKALRVYKIGHMFKDCDISIIPIWYTE